MKIKMLRSIAGDKGKPLQQGKSYDNQSDITARYLVQVGAAVVVEKQEAK